MIFSLFRRETNQSVIDRLHGDIMAAARQPALFVDFGIADTFEGRFEALALIATPPVRRLAALPEPGPALAQELTDRFFTGFDDALRQLGTSDVGVPRKMTKLASAWLGRRQAYAAALEAGDDALLIAALSRNIYATAAQENGFVAQKLAHYLRLIDAAHGRADISAFLKGAVLYPDLN